MRYSLDRGLHVFISGDQMEVGITQSRSIRISWTLGLRVHLVLRPSKQTQKKEDDQA